MNIAIIGVGALVQKSILPALREVDEVTPLLLGSRNPAALAALGTKYGCECGSYEEVIARDEVEAVYIALPNHLHYHWGKRVLEAGKHLLCEKPLSMTAAEALDLKACAAARGLVVMEAFMYRFHPQHAEVRRRIAAGEIGELRAFEACFSYSLHDLDNIRLQRDCGGGALRDVGCYGIDSARFILEMEPQSGICFSRIGEVSGVDELSCVQLAFKGGVSAQIRCGTDLPREQGYRVIGSAGSIEVPQAFIQKSQKPTVIKVTRQRQEIVKVASLNQYAAEFRHFAALVAGRTVERGLAGDGCANAAIIEGLSKTNRLVSFSISN